MLNNDEFRKAVLERAAAIVAECMAAKVEEAAQAEARKALESFTMNGHEHNQAVPTPHAGLRRPLVLKRMVPHTAVLARGPNNPEKIFNRGNELEVARLAWNSLHHDGHFASGRAVRNDLTAYLVASFPKISGHSFSSGISRMVQRGVLAVLPPGF